MGRTETLPAWPLTSPWILTSCPGICQRERERRLLLPTAMRYQIFEQHGRLECTPTESMSEQGLERGHVHSPRGGGNFIERKPEQCCDKLRREIGVGGWRAEA